ncbi:hypothetical protein K435DRAFT_879830 [Dendrothele bispora CBS 962.96]|uniref:Uncharacterized protein n=1 Tax=Dendrothele bispora (strain CBS 962.96) TaxID=1314807 RepID=A0A4V4HAL9_DENBC|nr:hypothetical protein K435DRAFT_879830 [Dendrothele bispora CBS 962.96]
MSSSAVCAGRTVQFLLSISTKFNNSTRQHFLPTLPSPSPPTGPVPIITWSSKKIQDLLCSYVPPIALGVETALIKYNTTVLVPKSKWQGPLRTR